MICNRCGGSNPEVAQFCCKCASPLSAANQQYRERGRPQSGASGRAITAMIFSVASLVLCCTLLGVPGMILGKMEMNAIRDGRAPVAGDGFARTAFYLGIAGTAFGVVGVMMYAVAVLGFYRY